MAALFTLAGPLLSKLFGKGKDGSEIQSVLFDPSKYSSQQSLSWLKQHGLKPTKRATNEGNYRHYRIKDPKRFSRIRTKDTKKGIVLRIGFKSKN